MQTCSDSVDAYKNNSCLTVTLCQSDLAKSIAILSVISIVSVILTKEVVMATDGQCAGDYQFKSPFLPGESCEAIYNKNEETRDKPGYYWILSRDYCGMTYTGSSSTML